MENFLYEIGQTCGMIGFILLTLLIFSGDTARFWNRYIGLDKIIKFQRKFSYFVMFFIFFHPVFFILSAGTYKGLILPDFAYKPLAFGIIAFYILVGVMIASALYKRISYKIWQYIHVITYILYFFAIYHAIFWGSETAENAPIYAISLILVITGIIYRTRYKIIAAKTTKFFVKDVKMETADTFTLTIKGNKEFKAGQFCFLRLNKNKLYGRHPFTVSSAPDDDFKFTIKLAGRFTQTAKDLKEGDEIFIDGPFGKFIPEPNKDLVFIAGGVGITPFMSILRDHIKRGVKQNITLIYGSRSQNDIIFHNELENIKDEWFKKVYMLNDIANLTIECEQGYITKDIINKYVKNVNNSLYYICGPERMKETAKKVLKDMGVKWKNIFVEDFFW